MCIVNFKNKAIQYASHDENIKQARNITVSQISSTKIMITRDQRNILHVLPIETNTVAGL